MKIRVFPANASVDSSVTIGIVVGFVTALLNDAITMFFTSPHYLTADQIQRYIFGISFAYGLLFAALSLALILVKPARIMKIGRKHISYPVAGAVAMLVAAFFRWLGSSHFDCAYNCADDIVPQTSDKTALVAVVCVLLVIYGLCVGLYLARESRKAQ